MCIIGLISVVILMLFPFYWMILSSLSSGTEVLLFPPKLFREELHFENYLQVLSKSSFLQQLKNSVIATATQVGLALVISVPAAFALSHYTFRARKIVLVYLSFLMLIPFEATYVFNYRTAVELHLNDSLAAIIIPFVADAFTVISMFAAFHSAPISLFESAQLEGASAVTYMLKILSPMHIPLLTTLALLTAKSSWNAFTWPMLVNKAPDVRTLPIGMYSYISETGSQYELVSAYSLLSTLPLLLLFLLLSRNIYWQHILTNYHTLK